MGFMQQQIEFGEWVEVDGAYGIECIPADLVRLPPMVTDEWYEPEPEDSDDTRIMEFIGDLADYIESDVDLVSRVRRVFGYGARLSAPGYADCTEWAVFPTEWEAREHLEETSVDE